MTGDAWKIEGRFKKKVKYHLFCARNLRKEVKRYTIKRSEQSIYNMADDGEEGWRGKATVTQRRGGCPKYFIVQ